jgi:hypothetical protein
LDYIVDECCARMRSSFTSSTSERGSEKQHKKYGDKYSEIIARNKFTESEQKRFLPPENPRPDRTHLVLDYVFNTLGHEAFATSTSTSSSDSSSSSLSVPISILKGEE